MSNEEQLIRTHTEGAVLVVTLDRPEKRNAITLKMSDDLHRVFTDFEQEPDLHVAVLTGAGSAFCAGADLKALSAQRMLVPPRDYGTLLPGDRPMTKPTIAAVNGPAMAGGFRLAQACDLCIAAPEAYFGITEVKRGRGSPWATPLRGMLPERVLNEILLTGDPISAERAYQVGFVNRVVAGEDLVAESVALAAKIGANAPLSVRAAKRMVAVTSEMTAPAARESAEWLYEHVYRSGDAQEGPLAFVENRAPRWTGA